MSNIKEVLYEEIDENIYSKDDIGDFYWYKNVMELHENFFKEYEEYQLHHINTRNKIISQIKGNETVLMNTSIFGISVINDKPILIVEVK